MDKGTDKQYVADFLYTVQLLISDVCTKFQNSRSSSSGEIFDKKFPYALPWSERLKKGKNRKRRQNLISAPLVVFTEIHLVVLIVYTKFEYCSTHRI